mgnify:CR=1 FL=1
MASESTLAYLNGTFLPLNEAQIPVLDRGFLFGDGVYEVIPVYGGHPLRLEEHLLRLQSSLRSIHMDLPLTSSEWASIIHRLTEGKKGDQQVYIQITRGPQPKRDHAIPASFQQTIFAMSSQIAPIPAGGICAITAPDIRWDRCDIKAITLLANVLLRQEAVSRGATEAIIVRDGKALEGAASNLFVVKAGKILTPPKSTLILPGITRDLVMEVAKEAGFTVEERNIETSELESADEVWLTSSTREILPVIELDGRAVGNGTPGPIWRQVLDAYQLHKEHLRAASLEH